VPPAPEAARVVFGPALSATERYAQLLAGPAVERGLLGPREVPRLWERHLLNCAVVAGLVPRPCSLVDLGSGAGLPGVVLALCLPDCEVTLLEPMQRRAAFLGDCVRELRLANTRVYRGRAEEAAGELAADVVTARAVAPLSRLAVMAAGLLRPGGTLLAMKGARAAEEMAAAAGVLRARGMRGGGVVVVGDGKVIPAATVVRLTMDG
jgi:16S rRNA (guanine527-N7)-methyltransferase